MKRNIKKVKHTNKDKMIYNDGFTEEDKIEIGRAILRIEEMIYMG